MTEFEHYEFDLVELAMCGCAMPSFEDWREAKSAEMHSFLDSYFERLTELLDES